MLSTDGAIEIDGLGKEEDRSQSSTDQEPETAELEIKDGKAAASYHEDVPRRDRGRKTGLC